MNKLTTLLIVAIITTGLLGCDSQEEKIIAQQKTGQDAQNQNDMLWRLEKMPRPKPSSPNDHHF